MRRFGILFAAGAAFWLMAAPLWAGVVVVQNWTPAKQVLTAFGADGKYRQYVLPPTDVAAIPTDGTQWIMLGEGADPPIYTAPLNSIYYVGLKDGKAVLARLKLPVADEKTDPAAKPPAQPVPPPTPTKPPALTGPAPAATIYKIPVAILVDTPEPNLRAAWEKKLRKRVEAASDIFEHHCRVRFEVVAFGSWQSNASIHSFDDALMDFARKVRPAPARVAIGFTSRYDWLQDESHLGGTHGALASHVLIRETVTRVSEPERLEVLVHELGHFLGSAHTSDQSSVMRPKLGDRKSTTKSFRVGFDAANTLVMNLIAEEMRTRNIWHPSMLSPGNKEAVRGAYMALAQTIPKDPVAKSSVESLGPPPQPAASTIASPQLIASARFVVQELGRAARENSKLPADSGKPNVPHWLTEDELTSFYIRRAAAAARNLGPQIGPSAFLLGLGVALDDSNYVRDKPELKEVWDKIDPEDQRQARMLVIGSPTILKRHDVVNHFTLSAALVVLSGPQGAEAAGVGKEILDSRKGNGFSFSDLCSDMSGVMFAHHVREENLLLADIAKSFSVADFVPTMDGLPEDVSWDEFQKQYGEANSENFQKQRAEIFHRIIALPPYRPPVAKKEVKSGNAVQAAQKTAGAKK